MAKPLVSIGMFVYNAERYLEMAFSSFVNQTYSNLEIIVSDNCSTDATKDICQSYASQDSRVKYIRQEVNLGAASNMAFVLDQAQGKYFTWAAADDWRSPDSIELCVDYLENDSSYVAATVPNCFEGQDIDSKGVNVSITGARSERILKFLDYCWQSHAIFYSVIRRDCLSGCKFINNEVYLAKDWSIDAYLSLKGEVARVDGAHMTIGTNGLSNSKGYITSTQNHMIECIFPLWQFSCDVWSMLSPMPSIDRYRVIKKLLALNRKALLTKKAEKRIVT